jgi:DNA repair exonuclease SbcCD nuclease subunit
MIKSTRFVMASDCHIRAHAWTSKSFLKGDAYVSFSQIVSYCAVNNLPLLLLGDILDTTRPAAEDVLFLHKQLSILQRMNVPVYWVCGNHDNAPWAEILPVTRIDNQVVDINGITVWGLDYRPTDELRKVLRAGPPSPARILGCHQLIDVAVGNGMMANMNMSDVPDPIEIVLAGDYHARGEWVCGSKRLWYNGSTHMCSISENPHKSFTIVGLDESSKKIEIDLYPLQTRKVLRALVSTDDELAEAIQDAQKVLDEVKPYLDNLPEEIRRPIFHLKHPINANINQLRVNVNLALGARCYCWIQPVPDKNVVTEQPYNATRMTQTEILKRVLDGMGIPETWAVRTMAAELLTQPSSTEVIHRHRPSELGPGDRDAS